MDALSIIAQQQVLQQNNAALGMVKKNAQAQQSLVNALVQGTSPERGQNVDITV